MNAEKLRRLRNLCDLGVMYEACPRSPDGYTTVWRFKLKRGFTVRDLPADFAAEYKRRWEVCV
jgi:hypothetical protein